MSRHQNKEYEHDNPRHASLYDDPSQPRIRRHAGRGFGTLIPDPVATKQATKAALEAGFRHLDCAERYRNEEAVGEAMQEAFKAGTLRREDVFVTTKLWNTNHRPERVKPAFDGQPPAAASRLCRLLSHPYPLCLPARRRAGPEGRARPGDLRFRGDAGGDVAGAGAPGGRGHCRSIGLSDITLEKLREIVAARGSSRRGAGRIPSVSPRMGAARVLPGAWHRAAGVCRAGTWPGAETAGRSGDHGHRAARHKTPAQVALAWAVQRGTAFLTTSTKPHASGRTLISRPCLKTPCRRFGTASPRTSGSTRW
jgi:hypothetical protein